MHWTLGILPHFQAFFTPAQPPLTQTVGRQTRKQNNAE